MTKLDENTEVTVEPPLYPEGIPVEEQRRAFLYEHYVNADIAVEIQLKALALFEAWVKDGTLPEEKVRGTKKVREIKADAPA